MPMVSVSGPVRAVPSRVIVYVPLAGTKKSGSRLSVQSLLEIGSYVGAGDLVDELAVEVAEAVTGVVGDDEIGVGGVAAEEVDLLGACFSTVPAVDPLLGTLPQNGQGWVPSPGEVGNSASVWVLASPWYNSFGWFGLVAAS